MLVLTGVEDLIPTRIRCPYRPARRELLYPAHTHTHAHTHFICVCVYIYIYIYIYICNEIEVLGMVRYAVDRRDVQDMETAWCRAIQKNDPCFQQLRVKF